MPSQFIHERFDRVPLHPFLKWLNSPTALEIDHAHSRLLLRPDAATDFWQRTHYGFRADYGHFLYVVISGDAIVTTTVHCDPAHQYDQAGLMVRFSADCWFKASNEFDPPGPSQLGTVATNFGFSDWSLQNFPLQRDAFLFSACTPRRHGLLVEHAPTETGPWTLMRIAHLHSASQPVAQMGLYACSPKDGGCLVNAQLLRIEDTLICTRQQANCSISL